MTNTKKQSYRDKTTSLVEASKTSCQGKGKMIYLLLWKQWSRKGRDCFQVIYRKSVPNYLRWDEETRRGALQKPLNAKQITDSLTANMVKRLSLEKLAAGSTKSIPRSMGYYDGKRTSWGGRGRKGYLRVLALKSQSPMAKQYRAFLKAQSVADTKSDDAETKFRRDAREALLPVVSKHLNGNDEWVEAYLCKLGFGLEDTAEQEHQTPEIPTYFRAY